MLGHGSPHTYSVHISRWTWHRKCHRERLLPWYVLVCALCMCGTAVAETSDLHLRVAWGGGTARQWIGTLAIDNGTLSDLEYLGLDADESATIYVERNVVQIRQRAGRDYDGFDIRVKAPLMSLLTLEIAPQDHPEETQRIQVPLQELVSGYHHAELDSQNNQLLIQRVSGDQLRVNFDRDALVFAPGEAFQFQVVPHLHGNRGRRSLRCDVQLVPARDSKVLWEKSRSC